MNIKKHKKILYILISALLVFSFSSLTFAEEFENINTFSHIYKNYDEAKKKELNDNEVYLEEVEDIIHLNNPTIKNNWNSFENRKSSSDIADQYLDAADALDSLASSATSDVQVAMYLAQADAMRMNADNNVDDSNTNFLNYLIVEKNLSLSTKILYIEYLKSVLDEATSEIEKEEAKRKLETAVNNESLGNGTKIDTLTARKNEADANAASMLASSNKRSYYRSLIINLGLNTNEDYKINDAPYIDVNTMSFINLQVDYEKAVNNNHQYEVFKRRKNNATTDEYKNQYDILINTAPSYIYSDLEKKYADIEDARSTNLNMQISYELYNDELKKAVKEFDLGKISRKEYLTALTNERRGLNELKKSIYDIYIAYITYEAAVNGLASASAG